MMLAAGARQARQNDVNHLLMLLQLALARGGNAVAFAAVAGGERLKEILLFQQRQRGVNHPRARHVQAG